MLPHIAWYEAKLFAEHASGVSLDAMHLLAGPVVQLGTALLLRSSIARPLPLLAVLGFELANEAYDFTVELWPSLGSQLGEGAKDIALTMLLPLLLFWAARTRPRLFAAGGR